MKRYTWFKLLIIVALMLVLGAGGMPLHPASAQEGGAEPDASGAAPDASAGESAAVLANLGSTSTYQGRLADNGSPANGSYDFEFRLWDAATLGSQVGSTVTREDVVVSDGLFVVDLSFGASFQGQALWLAISVRPGSSTGPYTALSPRQPITAAPYAHSLRPGANITGDVRFWMPLPAPHFVGDEALSVTNETSYDGGTGVQGYVNATSGQTYGVRGISQSPDGRGVYGEAPSRAVEGHATATSGLAYGVWGESDSTTGRGVLGHATALTGATQGVHGRSDSSEGRGVFGTASAGTGATNGVRGESYSTAGSGVYGVAYATSGANYGVQGTTMSPGGSGVRGNAGSSGGFGVFSYSEGAGLGGASLHASAVDDAGIAIWANSNSTDATLVVKNDGTGDLIRGFSDGWNMNFRVENDGRTTVGVLAITGGSDLSEQFDIQGEEREIRPGILVSIDPEHPGELTPSLQAYDRRVAGIISGAGGIQTGMLMGQEGSRADGAHPVALSGRVYCWADATYGPIEPGDLLTTSDTPGHAMKVLDYERAQGAIIGKAMSSLESGRGLILVLVSLQ